MGPDDARRALARTDTDAVVGGGFLRLWTLCSDSCGLWARQDQPTNHPGHRLARDEAACKPGPVPGGLAAFPFGDHPSRPAVTGRFQQSTRRLGRVTLDRLRTPGGPGALDLAPGGVCLAAPVTRGAGGLLHHRFTLTAGPRTGGGLFSVALSRGSRRVAVGNHPALWSPDFPRRPAGGPTGRRGRPAASSVAHGRSPAGDPAQAGHSGCCAHPGVIQIRSQVTHRQVRCEVPAHRHGCVPTRTCRRSSGCPSGQQAGAYSRIRMPSKQ